jgi:hypothetical protein
MITPEEIAEKVSTHMKRRLDDYIIQLMDRGIEVMDAEMKFRNIGWKIFLEAILITPCHPTIKWKKVTFVCHVSMSNNRFQIFNLPPILDHRNQLDIGNDINFFLLTN